MRSFDSRRASRQKVPKGPGDSFPYETFILKLILKLMVFGDFLKRGKAPPLKYGVLGFEEIKTFSRQHPSKKYKYIGYLLDDFSQIKTWGTFLNIL